MAEKRREETKREVGVLGEANEDKSRGKGRYEGVSNM